MRETEENYENLRLDCVAARIRTGPLEDASQALILEPTFWLSLVSVHACMQLPIRQCLYVLYFRIYVLKLLQLYTGRQYTGYSIMVFCLFRISYFRWRYRYPEVNTPPRIVHFVHYEVHILPLGFSSALSQFCRN